MRKDNIIYVASRAGDDRCENVNFSADAIDVYKIRVAHLQLAAFVSLSDFNCYSDCLKGHITKSWLVCVESGLFWAFRAQDDK
eukprot:scaffold23132_cov16-Prasinocladus_malaysianus.AAC.1